MELFEPAVEQIVVELCSLVVVNAFRETESENEIVVKLLCSCQPTLILCCINLHVPGEVIDTN